jgi:hypothetical protein
MYVGTDGRLYVQLFWDGAFNQITTSVAVNDGVFHHLAVTYDGANETVYLDGAVVGNRTLAYSNYTSNFFCQLGTGYTQYWPAGAGGWYPFNGIIDEVSLYGSTLTAGQVQSIYQAGSAGKCMNEAPHIAGQLARQTVAVGGTAVFGFANVTRLPNGAIQMLMTASPDSVFRVLSSTNLLDWQTLATLTNSTGTVQFTDSSVTNFNRRYYRLVTP